VALIQDFTLFAGDTRPVDGTAGVNLSGATVRFFMKASMDSTTNLLYKDTNSGVTHHKCGQWNIYIHPFRC
jgi:hypothetical protein